jgi:hypothetical protein
MQDPRFRAAVGGEASIVGGGALRDCGVVGLISVC